MNDDINNFVRKVEAGADVAVTQYFYNASAYFRFMENVQAAGVSIPVIAGIMPITNYTQLARFSDMCGAEIPRWIRLRLESYGNDLASIRAFGLDVVTELCEQLLEGGAPGLHFYSLNRAAATKEIWKRLRLHERQERPVPVLDRELAGVVKKTVPQSDGTVFLWTIFCDPLPLLRDVILPLFCQVHH